MSEKKYVVWLAQVSTKGAEEHWFSSQNKAWIWAVEEIKLYAYNRGVKGEGHVGAGVDKVALTEQDIRLQWQETDGDVSDFLARCEVVKTNKEDV